MNLAPMGKRSDLVPRGMPPISPRPPLPPGVGVEASREAVSSWIADRQAARFLATRVEQRGKAPWQQPPAASEPARPAAVAPAAAPAKVCVPWQQVAAQQQMVELQQLVSRPPPQPSRQCAQQPQHGGRQPAIPKKPATKPKQQNMALPIGNPETSPRDAVRQWLQRNTMNADSDGIWRC